jgi:DNA-binding NtrC family response regulator
MKPAIILVDDETFVLAILERILTELAPGYDLLSIADGATALTLFAERPIVLVLTDLRMPDMDGVALTVAIKAVAPQCPVVLMTGYPSPDIRQRADAAGVDFFLPKPFPFEQFVSTVRAALGR